MHAKSAFFTRARAGGDLAAGCMGAGQGGPNLGEILKNLGAIKLNPDRIIFAVLPREINPLFIGLGWLISPPAGTRIPFELVDPQH